MDTKDWPAIQARVERLTQPGNDRDVALAIVNQARLGDNPLSAEQALHLLLIGWAEGGRSQRKQTLEESALFVRGTRQNGSSSFDDGWDSACERIADYLEAEAN